jgi:hypothetical protein
MAFSPIRCDRCASLVPAEAYNQDQFHRCHACRLLTEVRAYPILLTGRTLGVRGETLLTEDQASCFNHPQKKAIVPCDRCGRFLCALCATPSGGRQLCLDCYKAEASEQTGTSLANKHLVRYDNMALVLSLIPFYGITAIVAAFYAIRHWKTRMSVLPQTRVRHVLALVFSLAQIILFGSLVMFLWRAP